jgi:hypothetical protein
MTQQRQPDSEWIWDRDNGYHELAKFASAAALEGLALQDRRAYESLKIAIEGAGHGSREAATRAITSRLYEALRARKYPYAAPLRYRDRRQRIRDPLAIHRDSGTCLDLALLFAAMCKAAGLRPFVVLLEEHDHDDDDHALVLIDLASAPPVITGAEAPVFPEREAENAYDVWGVRRLVPGADPVRLTADGIAVDVVAACEGKSMSFELACQQGEAAITDRAYGRVHFVDVVTIQSEDGEAAPPTGPNRPAIYPSLPPMPPFFSYPSRSQVEETLRKERGTVVLYGASGTGKSMLANQVAATVDHGCGWFLDASSQQSLTVALAAAEARAKGRPAESIDGPELKLLAAAALGRLARAETPWAVVLDNANDGPDGLTSLPEPAAHLGQLLIITTTSPAWCEHDRKFEPLDPLEPAEIRNSLDPDAPVDVLAGRPLLVDASRRFRQATGRWWWTGTEADAGATAEIAPAAFWTSVRNARGITSLAVTIAQAICWLPPVRLQVTALDGIAADRDTRGAVDLLRQLGLVDLEAGQVTMHRLFREAVRQDALIHSRPGQLTVIHRLLMDEDVRRVMEFAPDSPTARQMGDLLATCPDTAMAVSGLHALGKIYERHETAQASADWYARILDLAGWAPGQDPADEIRLSIVDSLRGKARGRMRLPPRADINQRRQYLDEAIGWTEEAERLCRDREGIALAASQAEAMRGLLLRQRARAEPAGSQARLALLHQAEHALRNSYASRVRLFERPADSPEVDRSQYNLAGLEILLAQTDAIQAAKRHLDEAEWHYSGILDTRRRRYRTDELEEVVCCINGQALVAYYRATLLDGTRNEKTAWLRLATERAAEAAAIRQRLAGPHDDANTSKSLALLAKVAMARLKVLEHAGVDAEQDDAIIADYLRERATLAAKPDDVTDSGKTVGG